MDASSIAVSVIMAVYNGEEYLEEQLSSVLRQTETNLELIIIDDGSCDASIDLIKQAMKSDRRVHLIENNVNMGFVATFERGINLSCGRFIALVDQDDVWELDHLEKLMTVIGSASLAFSDSRMLYGTDISHRKFSEFIDLKNIENKEVLDITLLFSNIVRGANCIFKSDLKHRILPFPNGLKFHDHWISFHAHHCSGIKFITDVTSYYRRHSAAVTNEQQSIMSKFRKFDPVSFAGLLAKFGGPYALRRHANRDLVRFMYFKSTILKSTCLFFIMIRYYKYIFKHNSYFKLLVIPYCVFKFSTMKGGVLR